MEFDIVRAWKDAHYRQSLTTEQQAQLPENPVGELELSEAELEMVSGGSDQTGPSFIRCQITGGDHSQCPTFGNPNGSCNAIYNQGTDLETEGLLRLNLLGIRVFIP